MRQDFSDYIVFVDESGDHGLKRPDPDYPINPAPFAAKPLRFRNSNPFVRRVAQMRICSNG